MPELPEVETIRRTLEPKLVGRTIRGGAVYHPKLIQGQSEPDFFACIRNRNILRITRRGKYLLIHLSGERIIGIHLRMTGQLAVVPQDEPEAPATYLRLQLDNGTELRFCDQRKFGRIFCSPEDSLPGGLTKLGPEPLDPDFTADELKKRLARRHLAIKKALLNQEILAGMGNIYADEALFTAGIHPERPADSLSGSELKNLFHAIRRVLEEGIQNRGTTKRNYRDGDGNPGSNQEHLQVYDREDQACLKCGTPIIKTFVGGRGTHFCPKCQK